MKKGKRLLALVIAVSLVAGLAPMSSTSYAGEREATLNETLVFEDHFDNESTWNSEYWNYTGEKTYKFIGDRDGTAPLGYNSYATDSNRNMYKQSLTDVHIKADVCVTEASSFSAKKQYHLLFARGENNGKDSIAFGFETENNTSTSSLVVAIYNADDNPTILHRTDASYAIDPTGTNAYTLDLYVIGKQVIAKCDGTTIYSASVDNINLDAGYCGILDKRATRKATGETTLSDSSVYGTDYFKGGYFDDFYLYKDVKLDGFNVNGPVIVDQTGVGVADITVTSNGVAVYEMKDVSVTVETLAGKECGHYEGKYAIKTTISEETFSATANRVFVVESVEEAVTSMNDSRWTGTTKGSDPNFTVDGFGKATLTSDDHSVLSMGENDAAYGNFYVEYTLNVSDYDEAEIQNVYTRFNIDGRASKKTSYSADILYSKIANASQFFFARLYHWCTVDSTQQGQKGAYANSGTTNDIPLGTDMKVGLLVFNDTVKYTLDGNVVKEFTATSDSHLEGWFAIAKEGNTSSVVTVDDFIYVPFKDTMVNVENFDDADDTFATWSTKTNVNVSDADNDGDYQVTASAGSELKSMDTFKDGYIEAEIAINEWTGSDDSYYPMELYCKRASSGGQRVGVRFKITKDSESYAAELQLVVREGTGGSTHTKSVTTLSDFAMGEEYTVRLTCIGNYVEARLCNVEGEDDVLQYVFKADTLETVDGTYGFINDSSYNVSATLDDLKVVEYVTYTITPATDNTISLPSHPFVNATNTQGVRTKFASGETVILTVLEDSHLEVGGLTYTLDGVTDSATYSVFERLYDKKEKPEVCNQFKFEMPSSDITLSAQYYDASSGKANIGARDTGIRENKEWPSRGLRFSSRAYTTYTSGETTYTLKEVGTLLFNGGVEITDDILQNCYQTKDRGKTLYDNNVLIGKCIPATKAQNICNDFWDWGVILTYADSYEDTNLYEKEYTAYAYAVYVDSEGNEVVKYASDAKSATHSYNAVAEKIGWTTH